MDDLAAELGMSKKTLYRYFHSKEELIDALITLKLGAVVVGFEAVLDAPVKSFAERVHGATRYMLRELGEITPQFLRDLRRLTPGIYARLEELRSKNLPRLWRRLLEEGIVAGAVRPEVNVSFAAQFFMLSVQAMLLPENLDHLQLSPSDVVANLFDLSFGGLLTPAGLKDYEKNRSAIAVPASLA